MFEVAPSGDDWMKLINPASGLCLQVSKNGQELTVEGGILNFTKFSCMFLNPNNFSNLDCNCSDLLGTS